MRPISAAVVSDEQSSPLVTEAQFFKFYDDIPEVDRQGPQWHCTGEYLKKHRPKIYEQAVMMLCEPGISIRSICRTLHISHNTVASIQEREQTNLDARKKTVLNTVARGLRLCAERVEELAPTMTARDAVIGVGVLAEKMQLLSGDVTQRIETLQHGDLITRFQEFCRELEKRVEDREQAQIGSAEKNKLPNGIGNDNADSRAPESTGEVLVTGGVSLTPRVTLALPPPNPGAR